jgi:hypothetical protein
MQNNKNLFGKYIVAIQTTVIQQANIWCKVVNQAANMKVLDCVARNVCVPNSKLLYMEHYSYL